MDFTVRQRGVDTSGRPILTTEEFWIVWTAVLARPRVRPFAHLVVIVQGAFMARLGGGAAASAGYHDAAGPIDIRTWNLSAEQEDILWWEACLVGAIYIWKRDLSAAHGGMDEHGHALAVWDRPLASGAAVQARQALDGRDGLAGNDPDYHPRPNPRPSQPNRALMEADPMADPKVEQSVFATERKIDRLLQRFGDFRENELARDLAAADRAKEAKAVLVAAIAGVVDLLTEVANDVEDTARRDQVQRVRKRLLKALADDPDVDAEDNPDPAKLEG